MAEDNLIELLNTFGYPVIRQGSLADDEEYPDTFFTFWNNSEIEHCAYDGETVLVEYDYDVNVYSKDPTTTYDLLRQARDLLKRNGWTCFDRGHDLASDEATHTGRGITMILLSK